MASCAKGLDIRELIGDELYKDYFDETKSTKSSSSATAGSSGATEFKTASSEHLERLISNTENKNTKKTQTWVNRFNSWKESREIEQEIHMIPPEDLDKILRFYAELVKNDGTDYEPESLRVMIACLDRHLREHGATYSILKDRCFETSRKILEGKAIELRKHGKRKQKMKADVITEEELLWERGVLGCSDAKTQNRTVFYTLSQHFGTRGRQEHHDIRIEELKVVKSPNGETDYVQWTEGLTKTRKGGLSKPARRIEQRMFAVGGPRCPVMLLQMMLSKRPDELKLSGPLYLTPLQKPKPDVWYSKPFVGIHTVNGFMKAIAETGGLKGNGKRYTNHSVRRVTIQKLRKAGVSSREIIAITGHKTEESLKDYDDIDRDDHRRLSKILSGSNGANGMEVASQSSLHNTQSVMTKQTTMLSTNPQPWPHMPFPVPCQPSAPVYIQMYCIHVTT